VKLQKRYQFDGILVNLPGRPRNVLDQIKSVEKTPEAELVTWRNGHVTIMPWDDSPQHVYSARPGLQPRADFSKMEPDHLENIDQYPGYVWNTYHVPYLDGKQDPGPLHDVPEYFLDTIDAVSARVDNTVSVHGEVFSPFTHYLELFGYQDALIGLVMDKGKAEAILDRLTDASVAWAIAQARHGVDAVLISSAFAGAGFISPEMYEDYVLPFERRVVEAVRAESVVVYTHTCGKIGDRLELMEATGTLGIDTLDPPPLGDVELSEAKQGIGSRLFLKGNMNSVSLLEYTTEEQVISEAGTCLQIGKVGGGYILSSACSIAPGVEPWKIELLVPLAEELGRY